MFSGGFPTQKIAPRCDLRRKVVRCTGTKATVVTQPMLTRDDECSIFLKVARAGGTLGKTFLEFDLDVIGESTKPKGTSSSQLLGMFSQDRISCI